ncbi:hypothetical protein ICN32_05815 [Polynucleobacter wuianus]|nr:hypothetical protein [Polynucleobacter wuianus]
MVVSNFPSLIRTALLGFVISAISYTALFYINSWLTSELIFGAGINWIYLRAGLRLFITLIFGLPGAFRITFASFHIGYFGTLTNDLTICIGFGLVSGFAPCLAKVFVFSNILLESDLSNLSFQKLLICILIYALLGTGLYQLWYASQGLENTGNFNRFLVMLIGDVLGLLLLISLIKSSLDSLKQLN